MVYYPCSWKVKILSLLAHILLLTSSSLFTVNANDDLSVLLSFKSSITNDPRKALSSWDVAGNGSSTPEAYYCQWNGVACNNRRHPGHVTAIRLRDSGLTGTISPQLGNLTRLQILDLSNNNLIGKIPSNLGSCTKLVIMNLSMNYLNGSIPDDLGHLSKLNIFNIRHNNITGNIPMSLSNLTRLTDLTMENNNLQGLIPSWFGNLTMLKAIDLAINSFGGHIPGYLGKLTELAILMMQGNRLEGLLPQSIFNISSIEHLDIGMNLSGSLILDIGFKLPKLKFLSTFMNHFDGPIPSSLSNSSALEYLIMHENRYHGLIPRDIGVHGNLKLFSVGHNELQATKPTDWDFLTSLTNCSNLGSLNLYENNLVGVMPATFANLSQELVWLRLHRNQISGTIPDGLAVFQKLTEFTLHDNLFTGTLPLDIDRLSNLVPLDLSHNRFEGPIPESLEATMVAADMANHGTVTEDNDMVVGTVISPMIMTDDADPSMMLGVAAAPSMATVVLSMSTVATTSEFVGCVSKNRSRECKPFPLSKKLCFLYFQGNLLQGQIPKGLNTLVVLENLDLSSNNFTGPIPEFLGNIWSLNYLNLSFNNLSGPVPKTGIFRNVMISTLQGNSMLCGGLPLLQLPSCPSIDSHQAVQHRLRILIFCIIGTSIFLFGCAITAYCYIKTRGKPYVHTQRHRFLSQNHERISYADLHAATQSFSPANLIGSGSFGNVYIGTLIMDDDLATVAIKVLDLGRQGASRSFFTECDALRRIRHRKLVKVITVCSSLDHNGEEFKALVLEFICNGSLDE
uniref:Protein kinase domain-containing protein n=1 Tax=Leersia perrieri TaxID=77586 RepID=A0A0D9XRA4_9ORYZ